MYSVGSQLNCIVDKKLLANGAVKESEEGLSECDHLKAAFFFSKLHLKKNK